MKEVGNKGSIYWLRLGKNYKAERPFRIAIVRAIWLTGFDAPNLSAPYLDKPPETHTLMPDQRPRQPGERRQDQQPDR